jgi:hypothetical protein
MPSFVWNHFKKIEKDVSLCLVGGCGSRLSCKGSSTRGMISHLATKHSITEENSKGTKQEGAEGEPRSFKSGKLKF